MTWNLLHNLKKNWHILMASQLRMPSGLLARQAGRKMNQSNKKLYQIALAELNLKDGDRILEIGFGNGKFFSDLDAKARDLQISGIDYSPEMVREAKRKNKDLYHSGRLDITTGNSDRLPYPDQHFDKVYCINVIYFWGNPHFHLKEIYRVLKPGGQFITGFRPKDNLIQFPFTRYGFILYNEEEWVLLLKENGFRYIHTVNGNEEKDMQTGRNTPFVSLCVVSEK